MKILFVLVSLALVLEIRAYIPYNSQYFCLARYKACQLTNNCYADPNAQPRINLKDILSQTGISYSDFLMMNQHVGATLPSSNFAGDYNLCVSGMWQGNN